MSRQILLHGVCVLLLLLSACGPVVQPTSVEALNTPAPFGATAAPSPNATSSPSATTPPTQPAATSTPLARAVGERPTPIPAPSCFGASPSLNTGKEYVSSVAVASESRLFASLYTPTISRTTVFVSDDNGGSWSSLRTFSDFVGKIAASPTYTQDRTVFAVGAGGVHRSLNGGSTWTTVTPGSWFTTTTLTRQFAISPAFATDRTILLGSRVAPRGVFASTDGGATWVDWLVDSVDALLISPNYAIDRAVWVARNDEQTFRRDVLVTFTQGDNWESVRAGTAQPFAISPAFAQDSTLFWSDPTSGLFFSRNSDKVFPLIEKAQADALKVWESSPQTGWSATGEQPLSDLAFSPNFAQDRTAFATSDQALMATRDGGGSWSPLCYWGFNAQKPDALRFNRLAVSANFAADQTLFAGGSGARLAVSRDGGKSWTTIPLK